jgi:Fe-S cluster assembly ATP-binding protein
MSNDHDDSDGQPLGVLAITHYNRLLQELQPDHVHILAQGRIVKSGGPELAAQLETDGYAAFAGDTDVDDGDASASALSDIFSL